LIISINLDSDRLINFSLISRCVLRRRRMRRTTQLSLCVDRDRFHVRTNEVNWNRWFHSEEKMTWVLFHRLKIYQCKLFLWKNIFISASEKSRAFYFALFDFHFLYFSTPVLNWFDYLILLLFTLFLSLVWIHDSF
jgi:hypothetical protein